ncbi:archaellin/type IV pilin N-terminal domain-containing protein [Halosimplex sp. J119]
MYRRDRVSDLERPDRRGQGSIGSLIVLIAALLIAATTAGVFLEVTGNFQQDTEAVGDRGADQISSRIVVVGTTGYVNNTAETVDNVTLVVRSDSQHLDLSDVVVESPVGSANSAGSTSAITIESLSDDDGSLDRGVLNAGDDRAGIRIELSEIGIGSLSAGQSERLRLIAPDGASTGVQLTVPTSLAGQDTVSL